MDSPCLNAVIVFLVCVFLLAWLRPRGDRGRWERGGEVIAVHDNGTLLVRAANRRALEDGGDRNNPNHPHIIPAKGQPGVYAVSASWGDAYEAAGTPNDKTPVSGRYHPRDKVDGLSDRMEGVQHEYWRHQ